MRTADNVLLGFIRGEKGYWRSQGPRQVAKIRRCVCGREYEVIQRRLVEPDPDIYYCECGEELFRWKGLVTYSVRMIKDIPEDKIPKVLISPIRDGGS